MPLRTCVHPSGRFLYGIHKPAYGVTNLRENEFPATLGTLPDGTPCDNRANFPSDDVTVNGADWVYEIANPLPFRGATFISRSWADAKAANPASIRLPEPVSLSMTATLSALLPQGATEADRLLQQLPMPLLLTLAATSTDPDDLAALARASCEFVLDSAGTPCGLGHRLGHDGKPRPLIHHHDLFETVANNPHLPYPYQRAMVLRPGAQGASEIVGEYSDRHGSSHVFEYLRRNSYIPWGHYAANMADDAVRYRTSELSWADMQGLRHLYYQRTYLRLAELLGLVPAHKRRSLSAEELEALRVTVRDCLAKQQGEPGFTATLWGWNFGYDFAASGYRLHASHQQIHQQYALLPGSVEAWHDGRTPAGQTVDSFACGDQVADFCRQYRQETGRPFFAAYLEAIRNNRRMDERDTPQSLVIHEDERVILFVPKAQTSQWELQIMTRGEEGNILETDSLSRRSLDRALLVAQRLLACLGARLVTSIEYAKRIDNPDRDQRLLYALLPKLPHSMGAFSEAQLRWINGHFPEDFAEACRRHVPTVLASLNR
ncbi:MAG: hypothetical protein ACOY3Z_03115 [Thermodesulfobacteriota bacterium]